MKRRKILPNVEGSACRLHRTIINCFFLSSSDVDYSVTILTIVVGLNEESGRDPGFRLHVLDAR